MTRIASAFAKEQIGHRLAAVREHAGMSQDAFAAALGISGRSYGNYERGEREVPVSVLTAVRDTFQVTLDWLVSGPGLVPQRAVDAIDFMLISRITGELDRRLDALGRTLRTEHRARIIKALYDLARDRGGLTQEVLASVLDAVMPRGR